MKLYKYTNDSYEIEDLGNLAHQYHYNDHHSIINITNDEYEYINTYVNDVDRAILIDKLRFSITYDYELYCDSSFVKDLKEYTDLENLLCVNSCFIDNISSIIKSKTEPIFVHDGINIYELIIYCANKVREKIINRINVEYKNSDNKDKLPNKIDKNSFIFNIARHGIKYYSFFDKDESRYEYYKLLYKQITHTLKKILDILSYNHIESRDIYVLTPFSQKHICVDLKNDDFLVSIVNALYNIREENRSELYNYIYLLSEIKSKCTKCGNHTLEYTSSNTEPKTIKIHSVGSFETVDFELVKEEIVSLRDSEKYNADVLEEVKSILTEEYKIFTQKNEELLKQETKKEIRRHFNKSILSQEQWDEFYYYYIKQLNEQYNEKIRDNNDIFIIHEYYYHILYQRASYESLIDFSDSLLLSDIAYLAFNTKCPKRTELYRAICILNYIKRSTGINDCDGDSKSLKRLRRDEESERAIEAALVFVKPLLNSKYINEEFIDIISVQNVIKESLNIESIRSKITAKLPSKFANRINFNLVAVLNILNVLFHYKIEIISSKGKDIISLLYTESGLFIDDNIPSNDYKYITSDANQRFLTLTEAEIKGIKNLLQKMIK